MVYGPQEALALADLGSIFGKPTAMPKPYVLLCPMCQKEFRREWLHGASLKAHQNTLGGKRSARRGYLK